MNILQRISAAVSMLPLWTIVVGSFFVYSGSLAVYRLYLSPLAGFPGPKLAALTHWYEFYWNVIKSGQFTFHIQDLHNKYGTSRRFGRFYLRLTCSRSNHPSESFGTAYSRSPLLREYLLARQQTRQALLSCEMDGCAGHGLCHSRP